MTANLLTQDLRWVLRRFAKLKSVTGSKEFKRVVPIYNKLARTLTEFQVLWHASWQRSLDGARVALAANLITAHPETGARPP